jgi:hypothetical protein
VPGGKLPAKVRPSFFVLAENSEKLTGISSEAKPWEFPPPFVPISLSLAPPDWRLLKYAAF